MAQTWADLTAQQETLLHEAYEMGYRDGGNNNQADWDFALTECCDLEIETQPLTVAQTLQALSRQLEKIRERHAPVISAHFSSDSGLHPLACGVCREEYEWAGETLDRPELWPCWDAQHVYLAIEVEQTRQDLQQARIDRDLLREKIRRDTLDPLLRVDDRHAD